MKQAARRDLSAAVARPLPRIAFSGAVPAAATGGIPEGWRLACSATPT
jgi:hypothetical protein